MNTTKIKTPAGKQQGNREDIHRWLGEREDRLHAEYVREQHAKRYAERQQAVKKSPK